MFLAMAALGILTLATMAAFTEFCDWV